LMSLGERGFTARRDVLARCGDASRNVAKQSFDLETLTPIDQPLDKLEDLTPRERLNMRGWTEHFMNRYVICGWLVDNDPVGL